jgi:CheY-like chemotaxis protein/anti-sigma regulatory factor (Ser/Thr protein kinase)
MNRLQARKSGLDFRYNAQANLPEAVYSDEKRLRQILINLLSNAIRYTDTGHVSLTVRYSGQVARFDIEDTGIGIAPEDQKRIFEPFERVEHPERSLRSGSGLGLTITRVLTEAMGGELSVTSEPGKGSRFTVRLMLPPVPATQRVSGTANRIIKGYRGARRRILIVDDDAHHIDFLRQALEALGFEIAIAHSGPEGIAKAWADTPDAVLLDIAMPGMNGWEVARRLRQEMPRKTPIVMISAYVLETGEIAGAADCHDAYLMKPVRIERLLDTLRKLLDLDWMLSPRDGAIEASPGKPPAQDHLTELRRLGQIGHLHGILAKLDEIGSSEPDTAPTLSMLRRFTEDCDLESYRNAVETMMRHDA